MGTHVIATAVSYYGVPEGLDARAPARPRTRSASAVARVSRFFAEVALALSPP
ncbi:MAG TPA: hypothetical protein VGK50_01410 [Coriobacteriia bacterium]|jgi:hypothetical protein